MSFVVYHIFLLVYQETHFVDWLVVLVGKDAKFVLEEVWFSSFCIIIERAKNFVRIEIVSFETEWHRNFSKIFLVVLAREYVLICESTSNRARLLIDQIPFCVHHFAVQISIISLLYYHITIDDSSFGVAQEISNDVIFVESALIYGEIFAKPRSQVFPFLVHPSFVLLRMHRTNTFIRVIRVIVLVK